MPDLATIYNGNSPPYVANGRWSSTMGWLPCTTPLVTLQKQKHSHYTAGNITKTKASSAQSLRTCYLLHLGFTLPNSTPPSTFLISIPPSPWNAKKDTQSFISSTSSLSIYCRYPYARSGDLSVKTHMSKIQQTNICISVALRIH